MKVCNDIARKHGNVRVKDFRKYEKLKNKQNKLKLEIDFLNNYNQFGVYLKFLIFKLANVSNKDALSISKRLVRSAINKRHKELQHVSKELSQSETFLSKQLSAIDFYILSRSITPHNKKSLQKSLNIQHKKLSLLTRISSFLPILFSTTTSLLHVYYVNIASYETLEKIKILL